MWQKSWRQVETRFRCQPGRRLGKRGETRQLMLFCFLVGILAISIQLLTTFSSPLMITNHQVEPRSLTLSSGGGGLQRKRSQSLADIQVRIFIYLTNIKFAEAHTFFILNSLLLSSTWYSNIETQVPLGFRSKDTHTIGSQQHKKFSKTKSEESGYDSDTTRCFGSISHD